MENARCHRWVIEVDVRGGEMMTRARARASAGKINLSPPRGKGVDSSSRRSHACVRRTEID